MNKVKQRFFNILTKHLFNGVTENDILYQRKDGAVMVGGKPVANDVQHQLAEQADHFRTSTLWRVMKNDAQFLANQKIYTQSSKPEDWLFGKTLLYTIQMFDKLLIRISTFGK